MKARGFCFCLALLLALLPCRALGAVVLTDGDSNSGWTSPSEIQIDTSDPRQGTGAFSIRHEELLQIQKVFKKPMDLTPYAEKGELRFWFYVDNPSLLGNQAQFELCSGGTCDVEELGWVIDTLTYQEGWNEITLRFEEASSKTADLSRIDFVRMYYFVNGPVTVKLDGVYVANRGEATPFTADYVSAEGEVGVQETPRDWGSIALIALFVLFAAGGIVLLCLKPKEPAEQAQNS